MFGRDDIRLPISQQPNVSNMQDEYRGFMKSLFVESLDYLVISALDGKICTLIFSQHAIW